MSKNKFGGSWTENKMEIVVSYAKAYFVTNKKPLQKQRSQPKLTAYEKIFMQ